MLADLDAPSKLTLFNASHVARIVVLSHAAVVKVQHSTMPMLHMPLIACLLALPPGQPCIKALHLDLVSCLWGGQFHWLRHIHAVQAGHLHELNLQVGPMSLCTAAHASPVHVKLLACTDAHTCPHTAHPLLACDVQDAVIDRGNIAHLTAACSGVGKLNLHSAWIHSDQLSQP